MAANGTAVISVDRVVAGTNDSAACRHFVFASLGYCLERFGFHGIYLADNTFLTPFLAIVGVFVISLLLFRKPFSYLQEIVQAAEQMQQEPENQLPFPHQSRRFRTN